MAKTIYLSIITLNVKELNASIKRQSGLMDTNTRCTYRLLTRDSLQMYRHIQTESKGMEKVIPRKQNSKESWGSNTYIRQNRL